MMKRNLCGRKVLVVLDDVDLLEQLEALAGESNWFKSGSRIIITTRDEQLLRAHEVTSIHDVNLLSNEEAICLFNRFAFRIGEIPSPRFKELSQQVVHYAAGLPLTIRVLGSDLKGKDEDEWKDTLESLKTIPLEKTLQKLELSYMGLERDHKDIFLDVACFWKGEKKDDAIIGLESCQLHAKAGLSVLEKKSLITVSKYGRLEMHDSIQEMGWDIVRRDDRDEPQSRSRLWDAKEIEDIFADDLGSEATRGIQLWWTDHNPSIIMKGLKNMKKLRFLHVYTGSAFSMDYNDGSHRDRKNDEVSQYFPNALQYLYWEEYPFSSLPITFQASNLVGLYMSKSNLAQLWEGGERKVLPKLRFLFLCYSRLKTLELGLTPDLDTLRITYCVSFKKLHVSAKCLKLKSLDISGSKLTTLNLEGTPNLETLYLRYSPDLVELQMPAERLTLKSIIITHSKLTTLDLGGVPNLETLFLKGCKDLEFIRMPLKCPKLKTLNLSGLKLKTLRLRTPNLESLNLEECYDLVVLHMLDECPKLKHLILRHSKLRIFNLARTPNLETLDLKGCCNLVKLHADPIGCLKQITELNLSGCSRFGIFEFFKADCEVGVSPELKLIVKSVDICPLHPDDNNLPKFQFECCYDEGGTSLIGNLEKLISVDLCACPKLESFYESICDLRDLRKLRLLGNIPEFPKDLGRLGSLEELMLSSTEIKHLPDSICMLQRLKFLTLESCHLLEKLPEDLDRLECLEQLTLSDCKSLQDIPDNICKMKRLEYLGLRGCIAVEKLPEELGSLEYLKKLDIQETCIRHLPQSIVLFKDLLIMGSELLLQSCRFTSQVQTSDYETFYYKGVYSTSLLYRDPGMVLRSIKRQKS